jgi:putative phosphoesterase
VFSLVVTIGVIADTHVPQRLPHLPAGIAAIFRDVDLILHAGDLNSRQVLIELEAIAPVMAVAGNADLFHHGLPLTRVIEIESKRIGLVHGHGGWAKYLVGKARDLLGYSEQHYLNIVRKSFGQVDAIVFGHTHRAYRAVCGGVLLFNPGSVAPTYYHAPGPQVGLLRVSENGIDAEILRVR